MCRQASSGLRLRDATIPQFLNQDRNPQCAVFFQRPAKTLKSPEFTNETAQLSGVLIQKMEDSHGSSGPRIFLRRPVRIRGPFYPWVIFSHDTGAYDAPILAIWRVVVGMLYLDGTDGREPRKKRKTRKRRTRKRSTRIAAVLIQEAVTRQLIGSSEKCVRRRKALVRRRLRRMDF